MGELFGIVNLLNYTPDTVGTVSGAGDGAWGRWRLGAAWSMSDMCLEGLWTCKCTCDRGAG